jgi:hypothetical protein
MNPALAESTVLQHCRDQAIGVSAIEVLPGGGVRLVCKSVGGADAVRAAYESELIDGDVERSKFRSAAPVG